MTSPASHTCTTCGSSVDETLLGGVCPRCLLGDVMNVPEEKSGNFDGHQLLGEIARGGMGVVYRARQLKPERFVALKTLRSASLDSAEATARFKHEAEVMVAMDHAAILPVYRCGEAYGVPFFTMKLVEGGTLGERMDRYSGQWREIAELMARVCDGVRHAHQRGVLHRDLKPGNILFDSAGQAYVSDFGIAKLVESQDTSLTLTLLSTIGTPYYLAPEIAAGSAKAASTSSDVWSLGVILYELLTGEKPFRGESVTQVLRALEMEEAIAPRKHRADVPRDLEVVTLKALARDPARRYATAQAFAEDLRAWLDGRPITARAVPAHERAWLWARRNPGLAGTSVLLVLAVFAAVASLVWGYVRVKQENMRVVASEVNERARLRESFINQARAGRMAHEMGWRAAGLKTLREAYAIRPGDDVRDEAVAHLAGFDLELGAHRLGSGVHCAPSMEFYLRHITKGSKLEITVHRMSDDSELFRLPWNPPAGNVQMKFDPKGRWLAVGAAKGETRVYSMVDHRELARWSQTSIVMPSQDGEFLSVVEEDRWVLRRTADWSVAEQTRRRDFNTPWKGFEPQPQPGSPPLFVMRCARGLDLMNWRTAEKVRHVEFITPPATYVWLGDYLVGDCANNSTQAFDLRRERSVVLPQFATRGFVFLSSNSAFMLASAAYATSGAAATHLWYLPTGARLAKSHGLTVQQLGRDDRRFIGQDAEGQVEGAVVYPSCIRLIPDRQMIEAYLSSAKSVDLSPDGKLLVIRDQNKLAVHDVGTGRLLANQEQANLIFTAFSHDGRELWLAHKRGIKVFKLARQNFKLVLLPDRVVPTPEVGTAVNASLIPGGGGMFLQMSGEGAILEWQKDSAECRPWIGPILSGREMINLSRDGHWIAGTSWYRAGISKATTPSARKVFTSKTPIWIAGISEGDGVLSHVIAPATRQDSATRKTMGRVSFSPDNQRLVHMDINYRWDVYEAPDWHLVATSGDSVGAALTVAFHSSLEAAWSPDGSWFAVVGDGTEIDLVEAGTWRTMSRLHGPLETPVTGVIVGADGSSLIVQRRDGTVEIWDLRKLEEELRALGMDVRLPPAITPPPSPPGLEGPFEELELPPLTAENLKRAN